MVSGDGLPGDNPIQPGPEYATKGPHKPQKTDPPSAAPTVVPTLSYSRGSSASNPDNGNVFKLGTSTDMTSDISSAAPQMASATTSSIPAMTPAPAGPEPAKAALPTVATEYYTRGNEAYEVIVVAEEIVVTVEGPVAKTSAPVAPVRRGHVHGKKGRRHGHHVRGF